MHDYETTELITAISQVDARVTVNDGRAAMWHATIGDLDYRDALDVVIAHYATATTGSPALMPGDVRVGVEEYRRERLAALPPVEDLMGDVDPRDPHYDGILADRRARAMERPPTRPALPAPGDARALPST